MCYNVNHFISHTGPVISDDKTHIERVACITVPSWSTFIRIDLATACPFSGLPNYLSLDFLKVSYESLTAPLKYY